MVNDLVPAQVDPNSADANFWRRYHAYRRERQHESRPDDPVWPDAIEEQRMRKGRRFDVVYWYEIADDGEMLSWFGCSTIKPGAPAYEENRRFMSASWSVRPDHRRRGIGRAWLPVALELMDRHGCTVLTVASDEESGHGFLKWLGAQPKLTDAESRLQLAEVDWAMVRRWIEEGSARSPRTRLEVYDGPIPEPMREEFAQQLTQLLNTVPFEQLEHGEILVTPAHMNDWYERMEAMQETQHTVVVREPDGSMAGMTDVAWSAHTPTVVQQRFTGVRPDARGRGIGKWIKATMVERIRELHPEARWISTWNAASNDPMLAINHQLGFRRYRVGTEYQITRDELAARIGGDG